MKDSEQPIRRRVVIVIEGGCVNVELNTIAAKYSKYLNSEFNFETRIERPRTGGRR